MKNEYVIRITHRYMYVGLYIYYYIVVESAIR